MSMVKTKQRRYRITPRTQLALKTSIAHWRQNISSLTKFERWGNKDIALFWLNDNAKSGSCPLCAIYEECYYCIMAQADRSLACGGRSAISSPWECVKDACLKSDLRKTVIAAVNLECVLWAVLEGAEK